uniref:Uncharacterized protein n=1 Tax=Solanum tuberosum TaxID=4113 RepID=M1B3E5_SOLTU
MGFGPLKFESAAIHWAFRPNLSWTCCAKQNWDLAHFHLLFTLEFCVYIERIRLYTTRILAPFHVYWAVYRKYITYFNFYNPYLCFWPRICCTQLV